GHVRELESSVTGWRGSIETLEVGAGDWVILGLPVAVLPQTCEELLAVSERWRGMVERVPAIPTYAIQLWLRQTSAELGWRPGSQEAWKQLREWDDEERRRGRPSLGLEAVLCGYDRDLNAHADMSHLIPREAWGACPEDARPRSVAYFCGTFRDGLASGARPPAGHYERQLRYVRGRAQQVFQQRIGNLWTAYPLGLAPQALVA